MGSMKFMSTIRGHALKIFSFDSSPGRAIAKALGDGEWDERTYSAVIKEGEDDEDEKTYEVSLRRKPPLDDPHRVMPLVKVGIIHWTRPEDAPRRVVRASHASN